MRRRAFVAATSAACALPLAAIDAAFADAPWPTQKALRVVVPFPPGGTTDNVTRLVMAEVGRAVGQSVVVENRPGAGTVIGVSNVARAAPDGYSFVTVANSFAANATLVRTLPYDTRRDLRPVALMGMSEHVLATHPDSGIRSIADLKAQARTKSLSFASFGIGTSAHLAGEMLKQQLQVDLVHVPYKGQGPAMTDLMGGHVTMMFGNWPEFRGPIGSGRLVAIGMATAKRSSVRADDPDARRTGRADRIELVERAARAGRDARRDRRAVERRGRSRARDAGRRRRVPRRRHRVAVGVAGRLRAVPERRDREVRRRDPCGERPARGLTMSLYAAQKFLFEINRDPAVQRAYLDGGEARAALLDRFDLDGEERAAIDAGDIGLLYVLGCNGQLLMHFAPLLGLPWADYIAAMRDGVAKYGPVRAGVYAMTTRADEKVAGV